MKNVKNKKTMGGKKRRRLGAGGAGGAAGGDEGAGAEDNQKEEKRTVAGGGGGMERGGGVGRSELHRGRQVRGVQPERLVPAAVPAGQLQPAAAARTKRGEAKRRGNPRELWLHVSSL